jgi:hypothetical protein
MQCLERTAAIVTGKGSGESLPATAAWDENRPLEGRFIWRRASSREATAKSNAVTAHSPSHWRRGDRSLCILASASFASDRTLSEVADTSDFVTYFFDSRRS